MGDLPPRESPNTGPPDADVPDTDVPDTDVPDTDVPETEPTPAYARPRFVASVVAGCALLAAVFYWIGNSGNIEVDSGGEAVPTTAAESAEGADTPEPGRREDCPDPGAPVEYEAAELVQLFSATATGGGFGDLPATAEVTEQLEATFPAPAVNRMTRIGGWVGETGTWSTCVLSSWVSTTGPMQSIDIVTASVVPGSERSDSESDEDEGEPRRGEDDGSDDDRRSSRSDSDLEDRWEITRWIRGVPEEPPAMRAATVEFYNSKRACRRPDRPASVPVPDEDPSQRLLYALEELASGTPGRANSAATLVPADVQVLEASVSDGRARVVLTPTSTDMNRCEGTGAYEQVRATAAAMAAETIPFGQDREPEVEVLIDNRVVDTLRP